jgi:acylphosphatase
LIVRIRLAHAVKQWDNGPKRFSAGAKREMSMSVCKRVHYWGTVQGVGFRVTTRRIANRFAVGGFVRNLTDGQVEVVVAGEPIEVERFLAAVAAQMAGYVVGHRIIDATEQSFDSFEIRM